MKGVGLENNSNNCYLNSIVQIFFHIPELIEYFGNVYSNNRENYVKKTLQTNVLESFAKLFQTIVTTDSNYTSPQSFKNAMGCIDQMFNMDEECDAQEFYLAFVNALQEGILSKNSIQPQNFDNVDLSILSNYKNYISQTRGTIVDRVFLGALAHHLTCSACVNVSCTYDIFYNIALPLPTKKKKVKFVLFSKNINEKPKCEKLEFNIYIETTVSLLDSLSFILRTHHHKSCRSYGLFTLGLGYIRFAQTTEFLCNVLDYDNDLIVGAEFPTSDYLCCFFVNQFVNYNHLKKLVTMEQLKQESNFKKNFKTNLFKTLCKYFPLNSLPTSFPVSTLGSHYVGLPFLLTIPRNYPKQKHFFYLWIYEYSMKHIRNTLKVGKTLNISLYPFNNIEKHSFKIIAIMKDHRHIIIDQIFEPFLIEHIIGMGIVWNNLSTTHKSHKNINSNGFFLNFDNFVGHPVIQIGKSNIAIEESYSRDSLNSFSSESSKVYQNFPQNSSRSSVEIINDMQIFRPRKYDCCLQDCIESYFNDKTIISGRSCSKCDKNCNSNAIEKLAIPPNILTIQLKRFNYQDGGKKTDVYVNIPQILTLNHQYILSATHPMNYRLVGMVCHIGTFSFGHYYSLVDEIGILNVNSQLEKWILFDDLNVDYISIERFHRMRTWAYLLFYKRVR